MPTDKGRFLSPSEICERVNLSDWEGRIGVGDHIFGASAWPEVSMMLTWLDIPGIYADPDEGIVCVSDHVTAWLEGSELVIENPTQFDAQVKVFTPARGFRVSVKSQQSRNCAASSRLNQRQRKHRTFGISSRPAHGCRATQKLPVRAVRNVLFENTQ